MVLNMFDEVHIKGISKTDASNIILFLSRKFRYGAWGWEGGGGLQLGLLNCEAQRSCFLIDLAIHLECHIRQF